MVTTPRVVDRRGDVTPRTMNRPPSPALRRLVAVVWVSDRSGVPDGGAVERERTIGSGATHLVFRLSDPPIRLYDAVTDRMGTCIGHAVVGGARATYYVRDASRPVRTVGAVLFPGTAPLLFG